MNASFSKRAMAYIIDYLIISVIVSLITFNFNVSDSTDKMNELNSKFRNNQITYKEYYALNSSVYYNYSKDIFAVNIISLIITIGYYIIFTYMNKGASLGKKFMNLKIVSKDDNDISFGQILIRSLFIYFIASSLFNIIFIKILSIKSFYGGVLSVSVVELLIFILTIVFMLYKKDKRGLHDVVAGTKVIDMKEV